MAPEYYAPAFIVKIDRRQLEMDVSKYIVDLSVTHEPDTMDHFSLMLANPFPELPWTHTDQAELFQEGKTTDIQIGYVDQLQKMFSGVITSISPSFPESGTSTLRIEGYTEMRRLQGSSKTRTFLDMTDKDIAEKIAGELNLTLEADSSLATYPSYPYVIQYNQTDLAFLLERAHRIGFRLEVDEKKLLLKKVQDDQGSNYTLVWGHPRQPINGSRRVMPLKSFNPTLNTLRQVTQVIVTGQNPTTRESFEGQAGPGDETTKNGSVSGAEAAKQAFGERIERVTNAQVASQPEAEQLARAIYNDRALNFVTGNGATIGLPNLRAGHAIELEGLGPRFSGIYYVTQTVHAISGSGYQTSFAVKRNAIG
jgi:uncharacterized protein